MCADVPFDGTQPNHAASARNENAAAVLRTVMYTWYKKRRQADNRLCWVMKNLDRLLPAPRTSPLSRLLTRHKLSCTWHLALFTNLGCLCRCLCFSLFVFLYFCRYNSTRRRTRSRMPSSWERSVCSARRSPRYVVR